jgi:hypothetical protein
MMRFRFLVVPLFAVLALPLSASAGLLFGHSSCSSCDSCGGRGHGSLFGGGNLANHPPTSPGGFGFFQPPFQAAPWYLYWPYDAHFQLPAPIGAPYYPPQGFHTPWNPYFPAPAGGPVAPIPAPGYAPMPGGPTPPPPVAPVAPPGGAQ